mgnify:CR=1 FL=1
MNTDLYFTLINKEDWKKYSSSGRFNPPALEELGYIPCYHGDQIQEVANKKYGDNNELFLLVIDPLRIQVPVKFEKSEEFTSPNIYGEISIDTIIDRIHIKRGKDGQFFIKVKHFD